MNNLLLLDVLFQISIVAVVFSLSLLFLAICLLVLMHICIVWKAFGNRRNTRQNFMNQQHGLSEEDLDLLPCHEYVGMESAVDCPVCLQSFENGDRCRSLLCRHIFHVQCVDLWLLKNSICPVCRSDAISSTRRLNMRIRGKLLRGRIGSSPASLASFSM